MQSSKKGASKPNSSPVPQYGDFNQEDNSFTPDRTGNSTYHAMQASVNKRFAQGLSFLVSYTVSKNITDTDPPAGRSGFHGPKPGHPRTPLTAERKRL